MSPNSTSEVIAKVCSKGEGAEECWQGDGLFDWGISLSKLNLHANPKPKCYMSSNSFTLKTPCEVSILSD